MKEEDLICAGVFGGVLFVAYLLMNGIYSFYGSSEYDFKINNVIEDIDESLKTKGIAYFKKEYVCEESEEELIIDKFSSTKKCYCSGRLLNGDCEFDSGCSRFISPKMSFMRFNGESYCVRKTKTYKNYLENNNIISSYKSCPSDYQYCGIIDSLERKLCLPKGETCPIKISDIDPNIGWSNKDLIFFKFKVEQNTPCSNSTQRTWNYFGNYKYISEHCTYSVGAGYYNENYKMLTNSTTQYELYEQNYLLDFIKGHGAEDNELKEEKVNLYARAFIGVDGSKVSDFSKKKLMDKEDTLNICVNAMKVVTYILIAPFVCFGACAGVAAANGGNIKGETGMILIGILLVLSVPSALAYFIICIVMFINHKDADALLDIKSDGITAKLIKQLMEGTSTNYDVSLATIIMFPSMIVITVLLGLCSL